MKIIRNMIQKTDAEKLQTIECSEISTVRKLNRRRSEKLTAMYKFKEDSMNLRAEISRERAKRNRLRCLALKRDFHRLNLI